MLVDGYTFEYQGYRFGKKPVERNKFQVTELYTGCLVHDPDGSLKEQDIIPYLQNFLEEKSKKLEMWCKRCIPVDDLPSVDEDEGYPREQYIQALRGEPA